MNPVDVGLLVLALTLAAAAGARHFRTPMSVVLAIAGIGVGVAWHFVPGLPIVEVPRDWVLFIFLPPLLTSAAYTLPLPALRRNLRPVLLLAVGLVLATMVAGAATAHLVAGLPWAAALVLGAIVAPPDPVAATSVAGRTGIAERLVVILEGEGLVNDAVAIVAFHLAVEAALTQHFSWGDTALAVAREAPTGVLVGLALGYLTTAIRRRLDDVTLEAGISLLVPYITYEVAERVGASAVLAVVTLGFVLQRHRSTIASPATALAVRTVWSAVRFTSTALVFFLLGVLMGQAVVFARVSAALLWTMLAVAAAVIVLRMVWMQVVPVVMRGLPGGTRNPLPSRGELAVLGWAGMRGVVSLALALALPVFPEAAGGAAAREAIIFITFGVIVATLVLQGTTLLPLIARLGVGDPGRDARDERWIRRRARRAGLAALDRAARADGLGEDACRALADRVGAGDVGIAPVLSPLANQRAEGPLVAALEAQRDLVTRMRNAALVSESLAERLATEIDVESTRIQGDIARLTSTDAE